MIRWLSVKWLGMNSLSLKLMSVALALATLAGQQNPFANLWNDAGKKSGAKPTDAVRYMYPEQVTVTAGKATPVEMHFEVKAGLHINSHVPKTKDMIPTTIAFPADGSVKLDEVKFPAGKDFLLPVAGAPGGGDHLSVYTGEFIVRGMMTATRGEHLVQAKLRYQACDNRACMPPHTIPVVMDVTAR